MISGAIQLSRPFPHPFYFSSKAIFFSDALPPLRTLAAIVAEFRFNWVLVADVLRGATSMSGNYRRPDMCRVRCVGTSRTAGMNQSTLKQCFNLVVAQKNDDVGMYPNHTLDEVYIRCLSYSPLSGDNLFYHLIPLTPCSHPL